MGYFGRHVQGARVILASNPKEHPELLGVVRNWPANCIKFLKLCSSSGYPDMVGSTIHGIMSHSYLTLVLRGSAQLFHSMQSQEHFNKTGVKRGFAHSSRREGFSLTIHNRSWEKISLTFTDTRTGMLTLII